MACKILRQTSTCCVRDNEKDDYGTFYYEVSRLVHFILEFRHNIGDEIGIGIREERHGCDQRATVVVNYVFMQPLRELVQNIVFVEKFALVSVLEVICDALTKVPWKFSINIRIERYEA